MEQDTMDKEGSSQKVADQRGQFLCHFPICAESWCMQVWNEYRSEGWRI